MGTLISSEEAKAAKARIALKREKRIAEQRAKEVTIKVDRKPKILGQFVHVQQNDATLRTYYIHSKIKGDFATVRECIEAIKNEGWSIINLPSADDERFYARQLFFMGGHALGVVLADGSHGECYTLDDLVEAGFLPSRFTT